MPVVHPFASEKHKGDEAFSPSELTATLAEVLRIGLLSEKQVGIVLTFCAAEGIERIVEAFAGPHDLEGKALREEGLTVNSEPEVERNPNPNPNLNLVPCSATSSRYSSPILRNTASSQETLPSRN